MYDLRFSATDSADWAVAVEMINDNTGLGYDEADETAFEIAVTDRQGARVLGGTTEDGVITRPALNQIQWKFSAAQMGGLCAGTTYNVGCVATDDGGSVQIFTGTLALLDGVVS